MAVLEGKSLEYIKKQIDGIFNKIKEGKYELDYTLLTCGTEDTEPVKDRNGKLWSTSKRNFHDTFTIKYIDREAEKGIN